MMAGDSPPFSDSICPIDATFILFMWEGKGFLCDVRKVNVCSSTAYCRVYLVLPTYKMQRDPHDMLSIVLPACLNSVPYPAIPDVCAKSQCGACRKLLTRNYTCYDRRTKTYIWNIEDLENPVLVNTYVSAVTAVDHNQYVNGDLVSLCLIG